MKQQLKNTADYFVRYNWWVFVTIILCVSYVWMQESTMLSWQTYLRLIAGLSIAYALPLGFAVARELSVSTHWSKRYKWGWFLCFILPPFVLIYLRICINDLPFGVPFLIPEGMLNQWGVPLVGGLFILADGFLWLANRKQKDRIKAHWITRLSVPLLALIVVGLFALFIVVTNNFVAGKSVEYSGWAYLGFHLFLWVEVLIIYLSYYLIYYLHHHVLYRGLLQRKGFFHYLMGVATMLLVLSPLYAQLIVWMPWVETLKLHTVGLVPNAFANINYIIPIGVFILSLPFIMLQEWYRRQHTINELEKEKTTTELAMLKQQINPHFFFNTLNNLYAMSLTQDEETPDTILKLSELMRYVIYQGQQDKVTLEAEIKYLQDYLDLQQIRLHQQAEISFQVEKQEQGYGMVAPLLFIILLENAFKHGIESAEEASFLSVQLTISTQSLVFKCHNSQAKAANVDEASGIGLQNLRRRLELLYPGRHELKLASTDEDYTAILKLQL